MAERIRKTFVHKSELLKRTRALETGKIHTLPPSAFIDANVAFLSGNTPWQFNNPTTKAIPVVQEPRPRRYGPKMETHSPAFTETQTHLTEKRNPITDSLTDLEKNILYSLALGEKEMSIKTQLGSRDRAEKVFNELKLKAKNTFGIDPTFDVMRVLLATATREGLFPIKPPSLNRHELPEGHLRVLQLLGQGYKPAQIKTILHMPDQEYNKITDNYAQQLHAKTQLQLVTILASINFSD